MIRILFVCHGNICRSPMAEFLCRDLAEKRGRKESLLIASAATSTEEIGNPVHPGTRDILRKQGISTEGKRAVQLSKRDYDRYDYLVGMDSRNIQNMKKILGQDSAHKIFRLLDFAEHPRDIADPWYTGDFQQTYRDVFEGCEALLQAISKMPAQE